uniref:Uncharacterized protein n=1 Tax=Arundo donax TaxID=35708 RepID=A0A0A9D4S5_ARUDO
MVTHRKQNHRLAILHGCSTQEEQTHTHLLNITAKGQGPCLPRQRKSEPLTGHTPGLRKVAGSGEAQGLTGASSRSTVDVVVLEKGGALGSYLHYSTTTEKITCPSVSYSIPPPSPHASPPERTKDPSQRPPPRPALMAAVTDAVASG